MVHSAIPALTSHKSTRHPQPDGLTGSRVPQQQSQQAGQLLISGRTLLGSLKSLPALSVRVSEK